MLSQGCCFTQTTAYSFVGTCLSLHHLKTFIFPHKVQEPPLVSQKYLPRIPIQLKTGEKDEDGWMKGQYYVIDLIPLENCVDKVYA